MTDLEERIRQLFNDQHWDLPPWPDGEQRIRDALRRRRRIQRGTLAIATILVAGGIAGAVLAATAGAPPSHKIQVASPPPASTSVTKQTPNTPVPPKPTTSTSATTNSSTQVATNDCQSGQLSASVVYITAAAQQQHWRITLTNASTQPCRLSGFVQLQMLDDSGNPLPTHAVLGAPGSAISVGPSEQVFTNISYAYQQTSGFSPCWPSATAVVVTPPANSSGITVRLRPGEPAFNPCDGMIHETALSSVP